MAHDFDSYAMQPLHLSSADVRELEAAPKYKCEAPIISRLVWGRSPQRSPGAEPLVGVSEGP